MQSVTLNILGRFWDSLLYKGRLYLFGLDGSLRVVNWNAVVENLPIPGHLRIAMECAFSRSEHLYGNRKQRSAWASISDPVLLSQFEELQRLDLTIDSGLLQIHTLEHANTPFPYAHNDLSFYQDQSYATSQSGVYTRSSVDPIADEANTKRLWDAPVSVLDIKYGAIALAAGDQGLFQVPTISSSLSSKWRKNGPRRISPYFCNTCSYASLSIVAFGYDSGLSLVNFELPSSARGKSGNEFNQEFWEQASFAPIQSPNIFREDAENSIVWGSKDRICMAKAGKLYITRFDSESSSGIRNKTVQKIPLLDWKGSPVAGGSAEFGTVLELENCMVVVPRNGPIETLHGEPTNWRIFPRSLSYVNQLHVIYDGHIMLRSYNPA